MFQRKPPVNSIASCRPDGRQRFAGTPGNPTAAEIGREVAISRHLQDGEEFQLPLRELIAHG